MNTCIPGTLHCDLTFKIFSEKCLKIQRLWLSRWTKELLCKARWIHLDSKYPKIGWIWQQELSPLPTRRYRGVSVVSNWLGVILSTFSLDASPLPSARTTYPPRSPSTLSTPHRIWAATPPPSTSGRSFCRRLIYCPGKSSPETKKKVSSTFVCTAAGDSTPTARTPAPPPPNTHHRTVELLSVGKWKN